MDNDAEDPIREPLSPVYVSPLRQAIQAWHQGLSAAKLMQLKSNLRAAEEYGVLKVGSVFSGSDVQNVVLQELSAYWAEHYGVSPSFELVFLCEKDDEKRSWLMAHNPDVEVLSPSIDCQSHRLSLLTFQRLRCLACPVLTRGRGNLGVHMRGCRRAEELT
jgi:hypothetical protein